MKREMNHYETLEVRENASFEVIKMAYKALAHKYHPDKLNEQNEHAHNYMQRINEAYDVLSDPDRRKQYDESLLFSNKARQQSETERLKRQEAERKYRERKEREKAEQSERERTEQLRMEKAESEQKEYLQRLKEFEDIKRDKKTKAADNFKAHVVRNASLVALAVIIIISSIVFIVTPVHKSFSYAGGFYTGQASRLDDTPNGYGTIVTKDYKYEGYWTSGRKQGKGSMRMRNGDEFEGTWVSDYILGETIVKYQDGIVYEGHIKHGLFNGEGTMTWANGDKYAGNWFHGKFNGKGTMTWANGDKYTGDWFYGHMNGMGRLYYTDGRIDSGAFVNDEHIDGKVKTYASGTRYVGEVIDIDDKPNGKGVMIIFNGSEYIGTYIGEFNKGYMNGKGIYKWAGGDIYSGEWKNNERTGQGVYLFKNGDSYEGGFHFNQFSGQGTYTHVGGTVESGTYNNGVLVGE